MLFSYQSDVGALFACLLGHLRSVTLTSFNIQRLSFPRSTGQPTLSSEPMTDVEPQTRNCSVASSFSPTGDAVVANPPLNAGPNDAPLVCRV